VITGLVLHLVSTIIMHSVFYGIIIVGSMIIALVIYNVAMFGWCAYNRLLHPPMANASAGAADKKRLLATETEPGFGFHVQV